MTTRPLLNKEERMRMADFLEEELKMLYTTYNGLSVVIDTISKKKRKDKLEYLIEEVESYIYWMKGKREIKRSEFPPKHSYFGEEYKEVTAKLLNNDFGLNDPRRYAF